MTELIEIFNFSIFNFQLIFQFSILQSSFKSQFEKGYEV